MINHNKRSRRSVLRATAASLSAPMLAQVTAAKGEGGIQISGDNEPVVVRKVGTWKNPISKAEVRQIKKNAIKKHIDRGGVENDQYVLGTPSSKKKAKIVDYTVGIQENGHPTQHVTFAGSERAMGAARHDGNEHAEKVRAKARGQKMDLPVPNGSPGDGR